MESAVRLAVEVGAGVAEAFRVFTEEFGAWYRIDRFTVKDPTRTVTLRFESGVGGRLIDVHDAVSGEGETVGRVTAWEPGARPAFEDQKGCEIEVRFEAIPTGTRVQIETRGIDKLDPDEARRVSQYGWHILTGWFEQYMKKRGGSSVSEQEIQPKGLVPYLSFDDAAAMLDWYSRVFGFVEKGRWTGPDGKVQNAEMTVGDTELWLDGGGRRIFDGDGKPLPLWVGVWVDDPDAVLARVKAAGVEAPEPEDKPYGVRMLTVTDPEGYQWGFMRSLG